MTVSPSELRRGIYRTKNPEGMEDDAQVKDVNGGSDMPLPESLYRERGYSPPFDDLPWREAYFAPKRPKDMNEAAKRIVDIATGDEPNDSPKRS